MSGSAGGFNYGTTDGGTEWTLQNTGAAGNVFEVIFVNANTGWTAGIGAPLEMISKSKLSWKASVKMFALS